MTTVSRLNVDVTATTGKFDRSMQRVTKQLGAASRAARMAGGPLGSVLGGGLSMVGRMGGMAGLGAAAGPIAALTAGIGILTKTIAANNVENERGKSALDLAMTEGISTDQAAMLDRIAQQFGGSKTAGDMFAMLENARKAMPELQRAGLAGGLAQELEQGDIAGAFQALQEMSRSAERLRIKGMLGSAGDDFMRLGFMNRNDLGSVAGDADLGMAAEFFEQQQQNPDFVEGIAQSLMNFFRDLFNTQSEEAQRITDAVNRQARSGAGL